MGRVIGLSFCKTLTSMSRLKLRLLYAGLAALLFAILWALARWVPGDRAAFFGAMALYTLPVIPPGLDLVDHFERQYGAVDRLPPKELRGRIYADTGREIPLWIRTRVNLTFFCSTLVAGLWTGVTAQHPLLMAGCFVLTLIGLGNIINTPGDHRLFGVTRVAATLSAAVTIGMAFRLLLH